MGGPCFSWVAKGREEGGGPPPCRGGCPVFIGFIVQVIDIGRTCTIRCGGIDYAADKKHFEQPAQETEADRASDAIWYLEDGCGGFSWVQRKGCVIRMRDDRSRAGDCTEWNKPILSQKKVRLVEELPSGYPERERARHVRAPSTGMREKGRRTGPRVGSRWNEWPSRPWPSTMPPSYTYSVHSAPEPEPSRSSAQSLQRRLLEAIAIAMQQTCRLLYCAHA